MNKINPVQQKELDLTIFFVDFCNKHNLMYYLEGGTCLGAFRHKGFIPWDDDIDIFMPRKDFDKFIELGLKEINKEGSKYFVQTYKTDPQYLYNYFKLRDNSTTFVESLFKFCNINHGVWIDVFPLDGLGNNQKQVKKQLKKFHHVWFRTWASFPKTQIRIPRLRYFFTDILIDLFCLLTLLNNIGHIQNKRIDKITKKYSYDDSAFVGSAQDVIKCKAYSKDLFGEGVMKEFEGHMFRVPAKYDEYLTISYGDYMTPPPLDKQIGHHFTAYENLEISYKDFKKNYKKW